MPTSPTQHPLNLFYSYAHTDEKLRIKLDKHLANLQRQGLIIAWHDRNISAGTPWAQQISSHLEEAHIILLLISADFLASDYCYSIEMTRAMERHKAGEAHVIPIILRPVSWQSAPFGTLQALPKDGKPVTTWTNQDTAWHNIAEGISAIVQQLQAAPLVRPASLWNVPYRRNPFFTGREDVLQRLHTNLTTTGTAALTQPQAISGLGGIGKTQIALEYAYRHRDTYHSVLWVQAATRETLIGDFVALADLLHLPERDEQDQTLAVAAITRWLASHNDWLLTLDNADDLAMVSDFLPPTSTGHLLLTTRAQAIGQLAQRIEIEKMQSKEGVLFLLRRASTRKPSASDRAKATEIVHVMDGLPLALDQAGAYIEETRCGLAGYLTLYQTQPQKLLSRRGSLKPDYLDSVAKTWNLSFENVQQLNPAAADLMRLCAFLAPDAIPETLITDGASQLGKVLSPVAADPFQFNEALEVLGRYSLLRRNPPTHTLSMHRLVQTVLKDSMNAKTRRLWASRTVKAVGEAFPDVRDVQAWPHCERALPHALACAELIADYALTEPRAAHLLNRTAYYLDEHARYAEAEPLYQRALAIREQVLGAQHPSTASSLNNLALLYYTQGKYEQAESLYQRALAISEQVLGAEHPDTATSLNNLAGLYDAQGKYEQAEPLYQRALAISEQVLGAEHPSTAQSLNNLAMLYQAQGKYERAEPLYQRALAIRQQVLGAEHPSTAQSLNNLAGLYQAQGKYEQAEPLYQRALAISEQVLGAEHPDTATSLNNLAGLYDAQGKYEQAEPLYQRALAIRQQVLGAEHPDTAQSLNNLAMLYQAQGKYERAEPLLQRALAIRQQVLGAEHPDTAQSLNNLAMLYYTQGKYEQAEPLYQRALAIRQQVLGAEHPDTAGSLNNLAMLYYTQGKYELAEPLLQRALMIYEQVLGAQHPNTVTIRENYAGLLEEMDRKGK